MKRNVTINNISERSKMEGFFVKNAWIKATPVSIIKNAIIRENTVM
jgi:hypothetical protein